MVEKFGSVNKLLYLYSQKEKNKNDFIRTVRKYRLL